MEIDSAYVSAVASVASAIVAALALYQLKIAKDAIQSGTNTQRAAEAARQCERYIEVFLPLFRGVETSLKLAKYEPRSACFNDYLRDEQLLSYDQRQLQDIMSDSNPMRIQILNALNQLEIMSVSFVKAIASSDVAYRSLAFSYCACVNRLGSFALYCRQESSCALLFSNFVDLYTQWEPAFRSELHQYSVKRYASSAG